MKLMCRVRGHNWQGSPCLAQCTRCGEIRQSDHQWEGNRCRSRCAQCGEEQGPGHDWVYLDEPAEDETWGVAQRASHLRAHKCDARCRRCGKPEAIHRWNFENGVCERCFAYNPKCDLSRVQRDAWQSAHRHDPWQGPTVSAKGSLGCSS